MSDDNESVAEDLKAENDPYTENEEDLASIGKDGEISSDDAQFLETELPISTQKVEKKKEKCGSKPKVKIKTLTIDGQLVYFCKICDKIFTRRKDKLNHELAHSGETMLTCMECGKEYLHESSLASHMRTHDGDPLFMCDLCPKMFAQSHHLKTHILSHSEPTNFTCKTCYKEFATAVDLSHHNRSLIGQEMTHYWCKMCKVYFCRTHGPECRKRIHAYCCSACNELFYTLKKLKIHMKKFAHYSHDKPDYIEPLTEEELYPHKLPESVKRSQSAKENSILKQSYQNLPNKVNKRCADEDVENIVPRKKFKLSPRKVFLEDEQSSTSLQDSAPEGKQETDAEVRSPSKYRKGKPYCKKCNRSFKDSFDLDRHRSAVHRDITADPPNKQQVSSPMLFTCKICSAAFATKEDLERHGFKHSGERMHVCPMCGEEFPQALQLTKHLKTHMGDHPYRCSQCGKSFRLKIQLIQHVRLHIVQDANSCDKCPSKFNTRAELQDHVLQNHREGVRCHLCGKTFNQRTRLLTHLQLQHCLAEPQGVSQPMTQFGLKRSLSMQDADCLISSTNIKSEPCGSDCESEQSFCSSFTRDSEKSDVYKYSSDESYSFKTTMAKERIRLRRKLRRCKRTLIQQQIGRTHPPVKDVKEELKDTEGSFSSKVKNECDAEEGDEAEKTQEVLDFTIELHVVQSEKDNLTTVFADVTRRLLVKQEPLPLSQVEDPVWDKAGSIHKTMVDIGENSNTAMHNFQSIFEQPNDILSGLDNSKDISCGNMLMFEFDPEEFGVSGDDLPRLLEKEHSSSVKGRTQHSALKLERESSNETRFETSGFSSVISETTITAPVSNISCGLTSTSTSLTSSSSHSLSATVMPSAHNCISNSNDPTTVSSSKFNTISSFSTAVKSSTFRPISVRSASETLSKSSINSGLVPAVKSPTSESVSDSSSSIPSGLARLQEVFQNSSKYLPLHNQTKETASLSMSVSRAPDIEINSMSQSLDKVRPTQIDSKVTENKSKQSQVWSEIARTETTTELQDGLVKSEPMFTKPLAKEEHNNLKKSQNHKNSRTYRKEKCKAHVKLNKSEVTSMSPSNQHSRTSVVQASEKSDLPHLNTSSATARPSSSFSSTYPSLPSTSICHGYVSNGSAQSSTSTWVPTIAATTSRSTSSCVQETSSSFMSQQPALYPNQNFNVPSSTPSQTPLSASSAVVIQPASIFDTNNPLLRDMNMMDLVRACTPAPPLPSPRPITVPTPLPQPEVPQQHNLSMASASMSHPVSVPVPSMPGVLPNSIPPPQTPTEMLPPPSFVLPQPSNMSVPSHAILPKPNQMDPQLLQRSDMSNYSNLTSSNFSGNQIQGMRLQGISNFPAQNLQVPGLTSQEFPTSQSIYPGPGSAFNASLPQPQHQLMCGPPDLSTLMNLNSMLSGGGVPAGGLVGNDVASVLSSHMRSLQESAFKESLYLSAVQGNGLQLQQNFNGMLVNGFNPQFQPNPAAAGSMGGFSLNPGAFSIGTGNVIGPLNFTGLPGGPTIGFGGQIPTAPQPQMVNILNRDASSAFSSGIGLFGHQPSAQLGSSLVNPPVMLPGGPSSLPANLVGVLGSLEPSISGLPPHFTGFPRL